jgi:hypothetical protein
VAKKTIIPVVEDEAIIRMGAVQILEGAEFATVEASNADDAMGILEVRSDNRRKVPLHKVLLFFLLLLGLVAPAQAAVIITFYSRDMHVGLFNIQFPHGFVVLNGVTDAGVPVDANYGFTATIVTPAIMFGPVDGEIIGAKPSYIADARPHFSLTISDDHYQAVMALMAAWRDAPQPSYDLNGHNCMTFVKATAVAAGLDVSDAPRFMREPSDFLDDVAARNPGIYNAVTPPSPPPPVVVSMAPR